MPSARSVSALSILRAVGLVTCGAGVLASVPACDSESGDANAPHIANLQIEDRTIFVGVPVAMAGSVEVTDPDGNLATLHLAMKRPNGSAFATLDVPISGAAGQTEGTLPYAFDFTADAVGRFQLEVWVEDADGNSSNHLTTSTSEVTATTTSAPEVTALDFTVNQPRVGKATTINGSVTARDGDGDLATIKVQLVRPDGRGWPEVTVSATNGAQATVPFAYAVTPDVEGTHVMHAWAIDGLGRLSEHTTENIEVIVSNGCATGDLDCTGLGVCYDVTESTCDYFEEHGLTPPEPCATLDTNGTTAMCVSSVSDPLSPLLNDTNRCDFVQYWAFPTDFPIDCRCGSQAGFDQHCRRPYEAPQALSYGTGPRIRALADTFRSWRGLVHGREWLLPVAWSTFDRPSETMIFAIHLDTGNRRYFSGAHDDPANGYTEVGTGDKLGQIMDMKKGPDGKLYAVGASSDIAEPKLWRIDPTDGTRQAIFDAATAPESELCSNLSTLPGRKVVQMTTQGWTMDAAGNFYFSNIGMPGTSILRLSVAGVGDATVTKCDYLTRVTSCPTCSTQDNVGGGFSSLQSDFSAFEIVGDKLYAVSDKRFLSIELATGNRKVLSFANDTGAIGTGPINAEGLGDRWTTWDPHRETFWTVGILGGSAAITVDPTTGNRTPWPCFRKPGDDALAQCGGTGMALVPGPLGFGGMVMDPEAPHDLYFAHDLGMGIVRYEVRTGNSYVFSM